MKRKILLFAVITAFIGNMTSYSQDVSANLKQNYVRLQYAKPMGEFSDYLGAGFGAEYGRHFYFNTKMFNRIIPGIDVTFVEFALNFGDRYNFNENNTGTQYMFWRQDTGCFANLDAGFLSTVGVKLGPVFTINIVEDLYADLYLKYAPSLVWGSRTLNYETAHQPHELVGEEEASMFWGIVHRFDMGMNIKYKFFSFGIELLFGSTTLNFGKDIIPTEKIQNHQPHKDTYTLGDKQSMGVSTFKLTIGYLF
ncbi:MAG: hypothetical protein LBR28_04090 [Bacteroidales bacterium]|jgi:hypothetical protein|nr:hypothetical protein [Bacteroidales bacterium]